MPNSFPKMMDQFISLPVIHENICLASLPSSIVGINLLHSGHVSGHLISVCLRLIQFMLLKMSLGMASGLGGQRLFFFFFAKPDDLMSTPRTHTATASCPLTSTGVWHPCLLPNKYKRVSRFNLCADSAFLLFALIFLL